MKKETITNLVAAAALVVTSFTTGFAQNNLGANCGCPPVNTRPTALLSALAVNGTAADGELLTNTTLGCDKNWILDKKIYVPKNITLSINPGTVIKGRKFSTPDSATALVVERGGKILASGTADCQIVFTAEADPMDGSYALSHRGDWGGVVVAGYATNNLTLAANGPATYTATGKLAVADGLGTFEGFASPSTKYQFGADLNNGEVFNDNDNSGILKYVSIRHAGAILVLGGELNGLSLGSVGRGTVIEHIDIVSSADDAIEFWGGTVNVKYISAMFGNDDNFDWDDGYSGKMQFLFTLQTDTAGASPDADNGFEMDADDNKSNLLPRSHPIAYNSTFIGNRKRALTSDNSGLAAIEAKELTEGEIYNSVFANFRYGLNIIKSLGTRVNVAGEAWANWANTGGNGSNSLKIKCNAFVNCIKDIAIDKNATGVASHADSTQFFTTDMNVSYATLPGFDYAWAVNDLTNVVGHQVDVAPNPALSTSGCPVAPADGFFTPAPYRGAFASTGQNWLSSWSYASMLGAVGGTAPCPTDINQDGITNNADFLLLLAQFNVSCQ